MGGIPPAPVSSEQAEQHPIDESGGRLNDGSGAAPARTERSSRRRRRSSTAARIHRGAGVVLLTAAVVAAPLAIGGVHRPTMIVLMVAVAAGIAALALSRGVRGEPLRVGVPIVLPLLLLVVPVLQSIPLPLGLRAHLDPRGTELLRESEFVAGRAWPLSLDPPATRAHIGRAAAGLAVFLASFHLATSRHRRRLMVLAVAGTGIAAVVIGLGHRIFGFTNLYGMVAGPGRTLLTGPFVNSNHTSEFLELAAFACLSCSFFHRNALNRIGWLVGAALCGAGALATISRGAVAALAAGALVFGVLRYVSLEAGSTVRRRAGLGWALLLVGFVVLGAGALGANQLVERFRSSSIGGDIRFQLWRDGLRVLSAHPLGIGRGAFERVFPVHRTIQTSFPVRFSFLENEPLQWFVDSGWVFFPMIVAAVVLVIWYLVRHARRDRIEGALLGGLVAVLVHSVVDFGLETMGVILPFMAVLGVVLGRLKGEGGDPPQRANLTRGLVLSGVAVAGLIAGTLSLVHRSSDDMDALLKQARPGDKRALLVRAQAAHPLDYFYALSYAQLEPIKGAPGRPSPRLHALNRALRLCPGCETVHAEVASNLWRLGYRRQSLLEWRSAIDLQPSLLKPVLGQLFAAGGKPQELAAVAATDAGRMVEVANFLGSMSRVADAFVVLDQADAMGKPSAESLLVRGKLQLQAGDVSAAQKTITSARAAGVQDPRLTLLEVKALIAVQGHKGADEALRLLDEAAARHPHDVPIARERVELVIAFQKWQAAERAIEGYKRTLYETQGQMAEAHAINARLHARMGRLTAALGEYRIALAQQGWNVSLWLEYGLAAEHAGRDSAARDAYREAARLSPNNPEIARAMDRIEGRERKLRALLPPAGGER
jgi:tetratricopeptide (TPR) repeat protein